MAPFPTRPGSSRVLTIKASRCKMATPVENSDYGKQRETPQYLQTTLSCQDNSVIVPKTDIRIGNPSKSFPISPPAQGATGRKEVHRESNQPPRRNKSWPGALPTSTTGKACAPELASSSINSGRSQQSQCLSEHPCTWPSCPSSFSRLADRDRHYQTVHANQGLRPHTCIVPGCQARVKSWTKVDKLREHNKRWHGPYPCAIQGCPRGNYHGFRSQDELDTHISESHLVKKVSFLSGSKPAPAVFQDSSQVFPEDNTPNNMPAARVDARDFKPDYAAKLSISRSSKASGRQNSQFTKKSSRFWVPGRVFKVRWSESTAGTDVANDYGLPASFESRPVSVHTKIRLFVVVSASRGHSICVAMHTYGGQGTEKRGINLADHVAVYGTGSDPPTHDGTKTVNQAIAIRLDSSKDTIHPKSCVNLAKLYTVEHNLKVMGVGKVQDPDLPRLQSMTPMQITGPSSQIPAGRGQNTLLENQDSTNGQPEGRGTSLPTAEFQSPQMFSALVGDDVVGRALHRHPEVSYLSSNFSIDSTMAPLDPGNGCSTRIDYRAKYPYGSALGGNNIAMQSLYGSPELSYFDSNFGIDGSTAALGPGKCHPSSGMNYRARNHFDSTLSGNHYVVPMLYPSPERSLSADFGSYGNTAQLDPNNGPPSERSYWARTSYDSSH